VGSEHPCKKKRTKCQLCVVSVGNKELCRATTVEEVVNASRLQGGTKGVVIREEDNLLPRSCPENGTRSMKGSKS
jgi:hypothetical protein